jgi:hypothetical protein
MTITLNHTIVPATTRRVAPIFCAHFWPPYRSENAHFAPVRINDTLTLLFDDHEEFESHHYAFHVSDAEFDANLPLFMDLTAMHANGCPLHLADVLNTVCPTSAATSTLHQCAISTAKPAGVRPNQMLRIEAGRADRRCALILPR